MTLFGANGVALPVGRNIVSSGIGWEARVNRRPQQGDVTGNRPRRWHSSVTLGLSLLAFALFAGVLAQPAYAQGGPEVPSRQVFFSRITPLTETIAREKSDPRPATSGGALRIMDWLLYGNIATGGSYDSNVNGSSTAPKNAYGSRISPSVVAERNTGIQRTLLYGTGDIRYYPSLGLTNIDNTRAGLAHVWEIERDFIYRVQAEGKRGQEISALTSSSGAGIPDRPVNYSEFFASTSIEKGFGRFFTAVGTSITGTAFQDSTDAFGATVNETYRNGNVYTLNGRAGYHISPIVYTFVEPSVNSRHFSSNSLNSNGYQIVGGLGSDLISLFNGEIYGGYFRQKFEQTSNDTKGGLYGGHISWFPTRFVRMTATASQSFGTSDFAAQPLFPGSATKINSVRLEGSWDVTRAIALNAAVDYQHWTYLSSSRVDDYTMYSFGFTYFFTERLGLTLDFSHGVRDSNVDGASYTRDLVSIGAKAKL